MGYKSLKDINFAGKKVILRVDYNVPLKIVNDEYVITDDKRIIESIATIKCILSQNPKEIIIFSHLGRPKLVTDKKKFTLLPVYDYLKKIFLDLSFDFHFSSNPEPEAIEEDLKKYSQLSKKEPLIVLVENTRFLDIDKNLESGNNLDLAKKWANLGDVFVFDGWGVAHRDAASVSGIPQFINESCLGLLVEKELLVLEKVTNNPQRPLTVIIGGAKVSDKIKVIKNILGFTDYLIIAGGLAFGFFKAMGHEIGTSLVEDDYLPKLREILKKHGEKIILPVDNLVTTRFEDVPGTVRKFNQFQSNEMGMDIGPYSIKGFKNIISKSRTIIWNGPVGVFEMTNFSNGTKTLLETVASSSNLYSFIGGGDTAAAVVQFGLEKKMSFISTGGGVCLTYLEGKKLKGIINIQQK